MVGTLRSDFLIHWTGKCIQRDYTSLNDTERNKYISRLRGTLNEGLWMTRPKERIYGFNSSIEITKYPVTCFTEIKLSDTHEHTARYGCLGFGFSRKFVIERCGAPVQYVSGTGDDAIIGNIATVLRLLEQLPNTSLRFTDEKFLSKLISGIEINARFIKNMSDCTSPKHDFQFLDEAEWRIVWTDRKFYEGKLVATGKENPKFKITFKPTDLRVLIFPDSKTRQQALADSDILKWFGEPPDFPIMATVDECIHF